MLAVAVTVSALPSAAAGATARTDPVLTVSRYGGGTVTSSPSGIDCGSDCSEAYPQASERICEYDPETGQAICYTEFTPQEVTLTATAPTGWVFEEWAGACSGTSSTCTVTMDESKSVTASFADVQAPTIHSISPTSGVYRGVVPLAANVSDNTHIAYVEFKVIRGGGYLAWYQDLSAPYGSGFDSTKHPDGSAWLEVRATDWSGNEARTGSGFTIDNTAPTVVITGGPEEGSSSPDPDATFTFSTSDAHPAAVECQVDSGSFAACSGETTSHDIANLAPGQHTFTVRATDQVGHATSVSRTWEVTRMPTALTVGVSKTRKQITGKGLLKENWTDEVDPIGGATVAVTLYKKKNGRFVKLSSTTTVTASNGEYSAAFARPKRGTCKMKAKYAGDANNLGSKKSKKFDC